MPDGRHFAQMTLNTELPRPTIAPRRLNRAFGAIRHGFLHRRQEHPGVIAENIMPVLSFRYTTSTITAKNPHGMFTKFSVALGRRRQWNSTGIVKTKTRPLVSDGKGFHMGGASPGRDRVRYGGRGMMRQACAEASATISSRQDGGGGQQAGSAYGQLNRSWRH